VSGEIVLENTFGLDGIRRLHVISGEKLSVTSLVYAVPEWAELRAYKDDANMHHLEASWPVREIVDFKGEITSAELQAASGMTEYGIRVLLWALDKGQRVSEQIVDAAKEYLKLVGNEAKTCLMRNIPKGAEEYQLVDDVMLIEAAWVPAGFIALFVS